MGRFNRRTFIGALFGLLAGFRSRQAPALNLASASPEAERAAVGSILMQPAELPAVARLMKTWMLHDLELRELYSWQLSRQQADLPYDFDALERIAAAQGSWVGSRLEWCRGLMEDVPNPDHASSYAEAVRLLRPGLRGALERWMLLNG